MKQEARLSVDSPWVGLHAYCFNSLASSVLSLIFFTLLYFLLALMSLQLDQGVTGLSRIWLPSGLALFVVLLGGYRLALVPVIGVLLLMPNLAGHCRPGCGQPSVPVWRSGYRRCCCGRCVLIRGLSESGM